MSIIVLYTDNDANQPVDQIYNGNRSVAVMKIRAVCPTSGSNDSLKS